MRTDFARAAIAGTAPSSHSTILIEAGAPGVPRSLSGRGARIGAAIVSMSELVIGKLPQMHSRLSPAGLGGRLTAAALAGTVIARGEHRRWRLAVLLATPAAAVTSRFGHDTTVAAAEHAPPIAAAVFEDSIALVLAAAVCADTVEQVGECVAAVAAKDRSSEEGGVGHQRASATSEVHVRVASCQPMPFGVVALQRHLVGPSEEAQ